MATGFGTETQYFVTGNSVLLADVTGDGTPDVIALTPAGTTMTGSISVLSGTGAGTFLPPATYGLGTYPYTVSNAAVGAFAVADVTGDGIPDLLVDDGSLLVLRGLGGGAFAAPVSFGTGGSSTYSYNIGRLVVADVNGDGAPDVLIDGFQSPFQEHAGNGGVTLLLNNGQGGFTNAGSYATDPGQTYTGNENFIAPDLNNDGEPDIVALMDGGNAASAPASPSVLTVRLSSGPGALGSTVTTYTLSSDLSGLASGDLNGDGHPDIITSSASSVQVWLNTGSGALAAPITYALPLTLGTDGYLSETTDVVLADVNNDGHLDVVVSGHTSAGAPETEVLLGDGTGHLGTATVYDGLATAAAADVNHDGHTDLAGPGPYIPSGSADGQTDVVAIAGPDMPAVCFCAGTRVLAARGEVAVEELRVGEPVLALLGGGAGAGLVPVRWLGHRTLDLRAHPRPELVRPVRIRAGALAEGVPHRDLRVSPGHALLLDGVLVQAARLVNGVSVLQEDAPRVTYWHVELDRHDALLAEGVPAESYLDCGNRHAFAEAGAFLELHPDFRPRHRAEGCAPLVEAGPALEAVKARVLARAGTHFAAARTADPALCLLADGRALPSEAGEDGRLRFRVPAGTRVLRLASRRWVPAWLLSASTDTRTLGVCVRALWLDGDAVPLDDPRLSEGWHDAEDGPQRWTAGLAALPVAGVVEVLVGGFAEYWEEAAPAVERVSA